MSEFVMGARLNLRDTFSPGISQATKATNTFRSSTDHANRSTKIWTDSQGRLRNALGRYVGGVKSANAITRTYIGSNGKLASSFSLVQRGILAATGAFGIYKAKSSFIDANADMETYKNTLTVVLKDEAKAIQTLTWAEKFAAKTPFEIPQIVEATTRMTSYGLNAQKTMGIIGDMASVMGKDLMQAVEAVADAQTGELERLKEFGITKEQIQAQAKAMKMQVINNQGQITNQKAFNAALFKLMETRYKGGMNIQSQSYKGMMSNLKDFVSSTARELGKPVFEKFKGQLGNVLEYLQKLKDNGTLARWVTNTQTAVGSFTATIVRLWPYVKQWAPVILGIAAAYVAYHKTIAIVTAATKAWSIAQGLLNGTMALNPIGLTVAAIVALIGVVVWAWRTFPKFREVVVNTFNSLVTFVTPAVKAVKTAILSAFNAVMTWVNTYWPKIQKIISFVWAGLGPYIMTWITVIKNAVKIWVMALVTIVKAGWALIKGNIEAAWKVISNMVGFWINILTGDWKGAWQNIVGIVDGLKAGFKNTLEGVGKILFTSGKAIIETLAEGIKASAMAPENAIKGIFAKVRQFLPFSDAKKGPLSQLTLNGGRIMSTLAAGVTSQGGVFRSAVTDAFNSTPGVSVKANAITPTSRAAETKNSGRTINIGSLVEKIIVEGTGLNPKEIAQEVIKELKTVFEEADDIAAGDDMGVLLI